MMQALCKGLRLKFSDVDHLDTTKLSAWVQNSNKTDGKKLLILDVREEEEFNVSHLHESILMSPSASHEQIREVLKENIGKLKQENISDHTVEIICYCSLGYRASNLARKINDLKSSLETPVNIYNLEGSLFKWANEGRPMVDGNGHSTKFAHPYSAFFGTCLNYNLRNSKIDDK